MANCVQVEINDPLIIVIDIQLVYNKVEKD